MAVIFSASGDRGSFQHSSRIIGPVVRWVYPQISDEALHSVVVTVRKGAHVAEYAILMLLVWRALHRPIRNDPRPWIWPHGIQALVVVVIYAVTDELHQAFVPGRQGSPWDVLIDSAGAFLALLFLWLLGRWRRSS